ncbi:alpha/beta hydrolase [Salsipaludibacter albus]|uniref:alpha/beta hydrolase n=1 Tax=Salsipaludibacter albus TaxID=2849650 RepID=UPI001EE4A8F7|nr:alpha/beta fold hydrolase [Salsipaludibacter albus]MBY5164292.1 alpha/beta fold hydrolase [Salsipaludibacter albus]
MGSTTAAVQPGAEAWSAEGDGDRAGTAVVLVHGFSGNPMATRPLGEHLHEAGFTVDVLRLPGHGTTARDMTHSDYADWRTAVTTAVDRALRLHDRVVLVGHSMGATLSLDLAGHRDDLAAVVAVNPLVVQPPNPLAPLGPVLKVAVPLLPRSLVGLPTDDFAKPGMVENAYSWVSSRAVLSLVEALPRVVEGLDDLTVPLLLVSSRVDHTVDPANSDLVADRVASRDLRRVWAERSWHLPQLDWERDEIEAAVTEFVTEVHDAAVA